MKTLLKLSFLLVFLFSNFCLSSQNLIPNGDFEDYTDCPTAIAQLDKLEEWFSPTMVGSPEFLHTCVTSSFDVSVPSNNFGYQNPQSGDGYAAIIIHRSTGTPVREYISAELTEILEEDACYKFEMFVNLSNSSQAAIDRIGAYFSDEEILGSLILPLPFEPTIENTPGNIISDTMDWTSISGEFQATGTEQYIIIGNFREDSILQTEISNPNAPYNHGYYNIDNVSLTKVECFTNNDNQINSSNISVFPNPISSQLNINIENQESYSTMHIQLFNSLGQLVFTSQKNGNGIYSWSIVDIPTGTYFLEINHMGEKYIKKVIKTKY